MTLVTQLPSAGVPVDAEVARKVAAAPPGALTELRLALVCDGGVSLAIYMHGVTKELEQLVRASRGFEKVVAGADEGVVRGGLTSIQQVYFDALLAQPAGTRMTVTIDVISGTSAGGINGVFLAKALTRDLPQDPLTTMWLQRADLRKLAHRRLPGRLGALIGTALVLPRRLGSKNWSPLDGALMSQWLVEALAGMDAAGVTAAAGQTLLPADHDLDLFVTTTGLRGYERILPSPDGGPGEHDRTHRKVFHFNSGPPGPSARFGPADNAGLAFAARCTSSFPGAFAPASLDAFAAIAKAHGVTAAQIDTVAEEQLADYRLAGEDPRSTHFADGGLLDNSPFDHVVTAIAAKSAQATVDRRIVHIDPDPGQWPTVPTPGQAMSAESAPNYLGAIKAALGVRSSQSLVTELLDIQQLNDTIGEVGRITSATMQQVSQILDEIAQAHGGTIPAWDQARVQAAEVHARVPVVAGSANLAVYQRLKVATIADMLASDLAAANRYPPESQQADFLRSVFSTWFNGPSFWANTSPEQLVEFLDTADMPYRERRLRFLISGINNFYSDDESKAVEVAALSSAKGAAWEILNEVIAFRSGAAAQVAASQGALLGRDQLAAGATVYSDPAGFTTTHHQDIAALVASYSAALSTYSSDSASHLWQRVTDPSTHLSAEHRAELIQRYLGFPIWDAIIFPVIALSRLPQLSPIQLQRFSPHDAQLLKPLGAVGTPKLRGTAIHHFGGFFDREWRENDYLWGRLDATELILDLIGQPGWNHFTKAGLTAVIDSEEPNLPTQHKLIQALRAQMADAPAARA